MSFHFLRHRKYNNCLGGNEFWDEVGFTCKAYLDYMRKKFNIRRCHRIASLKRLASSNSATHKVYAIVK